MNTGISWKLLTATAVLGLGLTSAALSAERGPGTKTLVFCDGGAQEGYFTDSQNVPASTASAGFVQVGTTVPGGSSGVSGDADTYVVTFAGESAATGGGFWFAQAQYAIGGGGFSAMDPNGPNTFHRGNGSRTTSMTWCKRINSLGLGTSFRIVWAKSGGGTAIIDDFVIQVHRSN